MAGKIVVGTVPFVNGLPLTWGLEDEPGVEVCRVAPSRMPGLLRAGRLDAALLPAIAYFRLTAERGERARAVPGGPARPAAGPAGFVALRAGAIGSRGEVGSVRLFGWTDIEKVRRVLLDASSRTSNTLARLLLVRRYGLRPHFVLPESSAGPALSGSAGGRRWHGHPAHDSRAGSPCHLPTKPGYAGRSPDAEVAIGDRGLRREPALGRAPDWDRDLGLEWDRFVHKPFVYAFWVARPGADVGRLAAVLAAARDRGLRDREAIAVRAATETGIPLPVVRRYLLEQVSYDFGPREAKGLLVFYAMAAEEGLAPPGGRLRFAPDG